MEWTTVQYIWFILYNDLSSLSNSTELSKFAVCAVFIFLWKKGSVKVHKELRSSYIMDQL